MDFRLRAHRRRNINGPGHAHELTFTCYRRFKFFQSDRACKWFIDALDAARQKLEFSVWSYVIMPEHVHLVIAARNSTYDISKILKTIKEPVGRRAIHHISEHRPQWLDKVTRRRGTRSERLFWQSSGGYDRNIVEPATLLQMIDYLHLNPVRRGLVERARDWPWSSAAWFEDPSNKSALTPDRIPYEWLFDASY